MKIRAQFYSHLRDVAGVPALDVDLPEQSTVADLLEQIYSKVPALRPHDKSILVGTGVDFVDRRYKVKPEEEISIMPPVQGG
jgi:molybdopterin converting factor small subunit